MTFAGERLGNRTVNGYTWKSFLNETVHLAFGSGKSALKSRRVVKLQNKISLWNEWILCLGFTLLSLEKTLKAILLVDGILVLLSHF
jgi:hypothetical protein